ncbi:NAD(P)-dependent oxidoreductase [Larkinella sp. VNQ87]|uniref:NAD(P)-dependent oxidoreductase n=1 Tax=Larkinella sp. VNQ87 TaxID=3400921 RepID=UPI003C03C944
MHFFSPSGKSFSDSYDTATKTLTVGSNRRQDEDQPGFDSERNQQRRHSVTALVRHPENRAISDPQLTVQKGDAQHEEEITTLVAGHNAVVSAYNAGWTNPNLYDDFLAGSQAIQRGIRKAGVKRLLVVGGAGSLEAAPGLQLVDTPQLPAGWKPGALAARDYLNILKQETDLEWTFLSPTIRLEPGERTARFRQNLEQPVFEE